MVCRWCNTKQRLIKAHIIPEGFFRAVGHGPEPLEVLSNTPGARPKRAPIGVYDKSILCRPCDNTFSPWDKHAQDVLLRDFSDDTNTGWCAGLRAIENTVLIPMATAVATNCAKCRDDPAAILPDAGCGACAEPWP
jgi:hypothetical protein